MIGRYPEAGRLLLGELGEIRERSIMEKMGKKKIRRLGSPGKLRGTGKISCLCNLGNLRKVVVILCLILAGSGIVIFFLLKGNLERNTVTRVVDGDSFEMKDGRRIRLLGVNAPEKGRCGWEGAYLRLSTLILNKPVTLTDTAKDGYGRTLANVWNINNLFELSQIPASPAGRSNRKSQNQNANLKSINQVLVEEGLVKFEYVSSPQYQKLKEAGQKAKEKGLGVWSDRCRSVFPKNNCTVKGNLNSKGEKHYLTPSCPQYPQTIVDEGYGDYWFCSEEEAVGAGYGKAEGCGK